MNKGAWFIIGGQWGDCGKGVISAYISARENAKSVYRAGTGPNAEHGIFLHDETTYLKTNQLPLGWMFNPDVQIRVGSGVAVDPVKLFAEMKKYGLEGRVKVDYRCPIVTAEHIQAEEESKAMSAIGSTFSGTGYCRADFVLRKAKQAVDIAELSDYITDVEKEINDIAKNNVVVIESSQGTFLSLAFSNDYPNVTSDNVTTMAAADDVLLNWQHIEQVVLVVKALPTREGAGKMGGVKEMSLSEIEAKGFVEPSSIGGVTRRKSEGIDFDMLRDAVRVNGAKQIALTFLDHYDSEMKNVKSIGDVTSKAWDLIEKIELLTKIPVTILNTGKSYDCIIDRTGGIVDWESIDEKIEGYRS
jgi:adenylosuccinate synthase